MLKKLAIIGLSTALIGCGTSNKALASNAYDIFTQQNPTNYDKIFSETSIVMGVLSIKRKALCCTSKQATCVF